MCVSHVQSRKLVQLSGIHCTRMRPLQVVVLLCALLYSTVQRTVVRYLCFKPRMSRSKHKSSGDVAGTPIGVPAIELYYYCTSQGTIL